MRDRAKSDGTHLVTVDVPGMTFQGPVTKEQVTELVNLLTRWFKRDRTSVADTDARNDSPNA
jgi:hypothetical protein